MQYLYWALFGLGFVLAFFAYKLYNDSNELLKTGIKTRAIVKDLIEVHDDDGTMYKPLFEYIDRNNTVKEFKSDISSRPAAYKVGEKVEIVYDADDNSEIKIISYWGLYRWTIILASIAAPMIIIGGGYLSYMRI